MHTGKNRIVYTSLFACLFTVLTALVACNSADDKTAGSTTDTAVSKSGDTVTMKASDTATDKMAKKVRKGKASVVMIGTNNEKMEKDNEGVYSRAETEPQYPGGQSALATYVENNINYPQQAVDGNIAGTVKISFVVDETGKVSKAHVVGDKVGYGLDEEALKVVNNMPSWTPGKVKGKNVKTRLQLPITFQVSES